MKKDLGMRHIKERLKLRGITPTDTAIIENTIDRMIETAVEETIKGLLKMSRANG